MGDDDPEVLFRCLIDRLNGLDLAYLHVVEPTIAGNVTSAAADPRAEAIMAMIRVRYKGSMIVCGGYDFERATNALRQNQADLFAFGRSFLANPDLPERFRVGAPLNTPDQATFYGGGEQGYTDYPRLDAAHSLKASHQVAGEPQG
jgi:N-ethylmaleimide reductase